MRLCLVILAAIVLAGCNARQIDGCAASGTVDVYCDLARPEDIEAVANTPWLLISLLGYGKEDGKIVILNPASREVRILAEKTPKVAEQTTFPQCGAPPAFIKPRGLHLSANTDGTQRLLIINAGAALRIEQYRATISGEDIDLAWEGCVSVPKDLAPNDIAALGDDSFVISHMYDGQRSFLHTVKFLLGLDTGYAVKWTKAGGWEKIPNTDASFANGIQTDPKTGRVFVASMFTQRIISVNADGSDRQVSARLPIQTDNLSWAPDGRLLGAGHTGFPVYGVGPCRTLNEKPCSFPSAVVALDPKTLKDTTLFRTDVGPIPGISVAIQQNSALYLGTAFGDRVTKVTLK